MRRLLFVSPRRADDALGGREQFSRLHYQALTELLRDDATAHWLKPVGTPLFGRLSGEIDGVSDDSVNAIIQTIDDRAIDTLWLDGTNLGLIATAVARRRPDVRIITFAHNVEADFFADALRRNPSPRAVGVLIANRRAEAMAARHTDQLIALNQRDSDRFQHRYGRAADAILPLAIRDRAAPSAIAPPHRRPYVLFVGGGFYANVEAIRWFAANVSPHLNVDTVVIGRDMDGERDLLQRCPSVRVVGAVDDLAPWYQGALAVIAPIFSGSGMKTKVAEAWMFGKSVVGTAEAFIGYDRPVECRVCDHADEFVSVINQIELAGSPAYHQSLRDLYSRRHSAAALTTQIAQILQAGA